MVSVVVCAVESRLTQAVALRQVLADAGHGAVVHFDTGEGPTLAHAHAWQAAAATAGEWCGVVEDDALITPDNAARLDDYLVAVPEGCDVVAAYLGTGVPQTKQSWIRAGYERLDGAPGWLESRVGPLSHVAVFIRTRRVSEAVEAMRSQPTIPCDAVLNQWCFNKRVLTALAAPSWFDHADGPTTVEHCVPVSMPRHAWRVAGQETPGQGPNCLCVPFAPS